MPPRWIRRPLTVTVWLIASLAGLVLSPVLLGIAAIASWVMKRRQPLVVTRLLITYFLREFAALIACGALWTISGAGLLMRQRRFQLGHWKLLRWWVHGIAQRGFSLLEIDTADESSSDATSVLKGNGPLLIFSRHAGPGDTAFLIDQLLSRFDRQPSVVFKETLAVDPVVDLVSHRLPHAVLDPSDREESEARIRSVSAELGPRGALLLFPEGGNFKPERRRSILRSLRRKGRRQEAQRAEQLTHVLPPRPAGALAALRGNPEADVIFAAHTGLGLAAYPGELWREMPFGRTMRTRMWLVPAGERPSDPDAQIGWLNEWWEQIDEWIEACESRPPGDRENAAQFEAANNPRGWVKVGRISARPSVFLCLRRLRTPLRSHRMSTARDPYEVLGLSRTVTDAELRTAYRHLVQLHHPDHNGGSPESTRRFEEIQDAYAQIRQQRGQAATTTEPPSSTNEDVESRLADLERELKQAQAARERARRAAAEAAQATHERPTDEELGYVTTDDTLSKVLSDARVELSNRFADPAEHPAGKRLTDLIDELAAKLGGRRPQD